MEDLKEKPSRLLCYYHTSIYSTENLTQDHCLLDQLSVTKLAPKVKPMTPPLIFVQATHSDMSECKLRDCTCRSSMCKAHWSHLVNLPVPQHVWKDKLDIGKVSFLSPDNHWHLKYLSQTADQMRIKCKQR